MRVLLLIHAVLLLLASTRFTIVTSLTGSQSFEWSYLKYASQSGFEKPFASDFSGLEVITYLAAFLFGVVGFYLAWSGPRPMVGAIGLVLSVIGLISFSVEGSHWLFTHHRSWLAYCPAAMFLLVVLACVPRRLVTVDAVAADSIEPSALNGNE